MMPVRQAIFRQVCMVALQIQSDLVGQTLQINARFGRLLLEERLLTGRSVRTIAKRVKVKREQLKKWESGRASPPTRKFIAIMTIYGREAMFRAAELDLQIQIEKYELTAQKATRANQSAENTTQDIQRLAA